MSGDGERTAAEEVADEGDLYRVDGVVLLGQSFSMRQCFYLEKSEWTKPDLFAFCPLTNAECAGCGSGCSFDKLSTNLVFFTTKEKSLQNKWSSICVF